MEFGYTPEQLALKERIHKFAVEEIRPVAMQHDKDQTVPWDVMKAAAKEGIGTLDFMMSMGSDPQGQFAIIYAEEMHWGCAGIALAISVTSAAVSGLSTRTFSAVGVARVMPFSYLIPVTTCGFGNTPSLASEESARIMAIGDTEIPCPYAAVA